MSCGKRFSRYCENKTWWTLWFWMKTNRIIISFKRVHWRMCCIHEPIGLALSVSLYFKCSSTYDYHNRVSTINILRKSKKLEKLVFALETFLKHGTIAKPTIDVHFWAPLYLCFELRKTHYFQYLEKHVQIYAFKLNLYYDRLI